MLRRCPEIAEALSSERVVPAGNGITEEILLLLIKPVEVGGRGMFFAFLLGTIDGKKETNSIKRGQTNERFSYLRRGRRRRRRPEFRAAIRETSPAGAASVGGFATVKRRRLPPASPSRSRPLLPSRGPEIENRVCTEGPRSPGGGREGKCLRGS